MDVGLVRFGSADAACEVASSKTVVVDASNRIVRVLIISFASSLASSKENYRYFTGYSTGIIPYSHTHGNSFPW